MHADSIRDLLARATPLSPVVIYLADGTVFTLRHADFFTFGRGGRTLIISELPKKEVWIDTALILRAELSSDE